MDLYDFKRPELPDDLAPITDRQLDDWRLSLTGVKASIEAQLSDKDRRKDGTRLSNEEYQRWRHGAVLALKNVDVDLRRLRQENGRRQQARREGGRSHLSGLLRLSLQLSRWPEAPDGVREAANELIVLLMEKINNGKVQRV